MKYGTFKYSIRYSNGEQVDGWSPYRGPSLCNASLAFFVQSCYAASDKDLVNILIYDVFEISKPRVWLAHVRQTIEFSFLSARGFLPPVAANAY